MNPSRVGRSLARMCLAIFSGLIVNTQAQVVALDARNAFDADYNLAAGQDLLFNDSSLFSDADAGADYIRFCMATTRCS